MPWPRRPLTDQLLALTRENLSPGDYERAWQDGERLTMADLFGRSGAAARLT